LLSNHLNLRQAYESSPLIPSGTLQQILYSFSQDQNPSDRPTGSHYNLKNQHRSQIHLEASDSVVWVCAALGTMLLQLTPAAEKLVRLADPC